MWLFTTLDLHQKYGASSLVAILQRRISARRPLLPRGRQAQRRTAARRPRPRTL